MKRIVAFIYIGLLISVSALGQERTKVNTIKLGRLDAVSQPGEVEMIVSSLNKQYSNFRVNTQLNFPDSNCFRLADLSKVSAVTKADFDKNGFTDVLVIGQMGTTPVILGLMGYDGGKIDMHIINRHLRRTCSIAQLNYEDKEALIELKQFNEHYAYVSDSEPVNSVKLIFKFGDFIEYNASPKNYDIEKIEFENDGGVWMPNSGFSLEINSNRKSRYRLENADHLTRRQNEYINFEGLISDTIYNEISGLLNYSDFPDLQENYAIKATDNATATLKITYDGGRVKTITDYGLLGTYSLNRVYQLMNSLRRQPWKPEPVKALVPSPQVP